MVSAVLEDLHSEEDKYAEYLEGMEARSYSPHLYSRWQAVDLIVQKEQGDAIVISTIALVLVFGECARPCFREAYPVC